MYLFQISYKFSQISIKTKLKHCFFVAEMTIQMTKLVYNLVVHAIWFYIKMVRVNEKKIIWKHIFLSNLLKCSDIALKVFFCRTGKLHCIDAKL